MIAIIYRWKLHEEKREQFLDAWVGVTNHYMDQGSLGSALFDAPDGSVYAIARWPSLQARQAAFENSDSQGLFERMADAVAELFDEQIIAERVNLWS